MKKSMEDKIETVQKEMVKSNQLHNQDPKPEVDTRSARERAIAWRNEINKKEK